MTRSKVLILTYSWNIREGDSDHLLLLVFRFHSHNVYTLLYALEYAYRIMTLCHDAQFRNLSSPIFSVKIIYFTKLKVTLISL